MDAIRLRVETGSSSIVVLIWGNGVSDLYSCAPFCRREERRLAVYQYHCVGYPLGRVSLSDTVDRLADKYHIPSPG